jgi:hypothetical protein
MGGKTSTPIPTISANTVLLEKTTTQTQKLLHVRPIREPSVKHVDSKEKQHLLEVGKKLGI